MAVSKRMLRMDGRDEGDEKGGECSWFSKEVPFFFVGSFVDGGAVE